MAIEDRLQVVSSAATGGDVVAILLRQAIVKQNIRRPREGVPFTVENPTPFIAGIPVSTRSQEAYMYQADITKHAVESGAILSDHVILQPVRLDLAFGISNWEPGYAEYAFDLLEALWRSRSPIELITEHKRMPDMILTSLQADNSAPQWGVLNCRASFQQLKFVTLESVKFPAAKVATEEETGGPSTPKSAETKTDNGKQSPRTSSLSTLWKGVQNG